MANGGFEAARNRCPARSAGGRCAGAEQYPGVRGDPAFPSMRIGVFTAIERTRDKWKPEYDRRTAIQRVNSHWDVSFGFAWHPHARHGTRTHPAATSRTPP